MPLRESAAVFTGWNLWDLSSKPNRPPAVKPGGLAVAELRARHRAREPAALAFAPSRNHPDQRPFRHPFTHIELSGELLSRS
jgi:hypothetical protein